MATYISFLRGVNVGGHRSIKMDELRECYLAAGLRAPRPYLQSGNVVFDADRATVETLADKIAARIERDFGMEVPILVKKPAQLAKILKQNPFARERGITLRELYVTLLFKPVGKPTWTALEAPVGEDRFHPSGDIIYLHCRQYGRTKLSNSFFERKLKVLATTRNWNTLQELHRLACEPAVPLLR